MDALARPQATRTLQCYSCPLKTQADQAPCSSNLTQYPGSFQRKQDKDDLARLIMFLSANHSARHNTKTMFKNSGREYSDHLSLRLKIRQMCKCKGSITNPGEKPVLDSRRYIGARQSQKRPLLFRVSTGVVVSQTGG